MKPEFVGRRVGAKMASSNPNISSELSSVDELQAEVERLREKLARKARAEPIKYLGEVLAQDLLPELAAGRKLSPVAARTRGEGYHGDGGNLWLQVTPGGRSWLFRYRWAGRQREMGLGALTEVSLAEARGRAAICRRLVRGGVDPIERKRATAAQRVAAEAKHLSFKRAAERYIEAHKAGWKSDKHAAQWTATLDAYAHPVLGALSVRDIDTGAVLKVLEPIWAEKAETASRVRGRIEAVLDWARVRGHRDGENPARWRGHLDKLLPKRSKVQTVKHHAALPYKAMNGFWEDLKSREGVGAEALRFTILTAARTGEVIGAQWTEIDLKDKVWIIPPTRMKAGREHRVPLSHLAVEVLERLAPLRRDDTDWVFPGLKAGKPLSSMAMLMLLRQMEWDDLTAHGFRSTFRDWAAEMTAFPGEMVEMALAHTIGDKTEAAYRRGDMFERRRRLMSDWATFCITAPKAASNVRSIGEARGA
jgi:integrase